MTGRQGGPCEILSTRAGEYALRTEYDLLQIVFATTVVVWLNQTVQAEAIMWYKELGMFVVLFIAIVFSLGVLSASRFLHALLLGEFGTGSKLLSQGIDLIVKIVGSCIICGIVATLYLYFLYGDWLFSSSFFGAFIAIMGVDLFLLRQAGRMRVGKTR